MSGKRSELESVAKDAVQRSGLHDLSFRTLADKVGVKSASVHYYFPEKSDLARTLIETYTADFSEKLAAIDRRKLSLLKKLEAFIRIFEEVLKDDKFCLCGMMAAEVATLNDENRALLSKYFQQAERWLCTAFEQDGGQPVAGMKPQVLARILMSGLEGAILIDRVDGGLHRLRAQRELVRSLLA